MTSLSEGMVLLVYIPAFIPMPGPLELMVILVVVLIIFGPKRLPELGKALGSTVRELRSASQKDDKESDAAKTEAQVEEKEEVKTS